MARVCSPVSAGRSPVLGCSRVAGLGPAESMLSPARALPAEAYKLNPEYAGAFNNRGNAYLDQGDYGRAIRDYDRAIELDPEEAGVFINRGAAYCDLGDCARAIADYDRAIELDRYLAEGYWGRGLVHRDLGNARAALADFRRYLELRPDAECREMFEEWISELEAEVSGP